MNMNREYRRELKQLVKERKTINRKCAADCRPIHKLMAANRRANTRHLRTIARIEKSAQRQAQKLDRRISILEGRLS